MEDHVTSTVNDLLVFYKATKSNGPAQEDIDKNTELQKKIIQKSEFLDSLKRVVSGLNSFLLGVQSEQNVAVCAKGLLKESNASVIELVEKYKENFRMEMRNRTDQILYGPVEPRGNLLRDRKLERIREVVKEQERTIAALESSPRMLQWERQKNEEDTIKQEIADIECETAKVCQIYAEEEGKIGSILVKIGINIGEEMLRINELSNNNVETIRHREEKSLDLQLCVTSQQLLEDTLPERQMLKGDDGEQFSVLDPSMLFCGCPFKNPNDFPELWQILQSTKLETKNQAKRNNIENKFKYSKRGEENKKRCKSEYWKKRNAQSDGGPPGKRLANTNCYKRNKHRNQTNVLTAVHGGSNSIIPRISVASKTVNRKYGPE